LRTARSTQLGSENNQPTAAPSLLRAFRHPAGEIALLAGDASPQRFFLPEETTMHRDDYRGFLRFLDTASWDQLERTLDQVQALTPRLTEDGARADARCYARGLRRELAARAEVGQRR